MGAFAALNLSNHVPANVAMTPSRIDANGVALWRDNAATITDAAWLLTSSVRLPAKNSQVARITHKLVIPVMDPTVTTKKIGELIGTVEIVVPKVASSNQRVDMANALQSLLALTVYTNAVVYLESVY